MGHYISQINIEQLKHLSNISIKLNDVKRQHLLITGKNGSGKTTLLLAIQKYLSAINDGKLTSLSKYYERWIEQANSRMATASEQEDIFKAGKDLKKYQDLLAKYKDGIEVIFTRAEELDLIYVNGEFITAYFPANRKTTIELARGVEEIKLNDFYGVNSNPGNILLKYMVHLKTQQAYARNEGDMRTVKKIQCWFSRFEDALKILLDNDSVTLKYDYKEYDFKILEDGRNEFGFNQLSDGYSSLINIVSDLILRMDKNWLMKDEISSYDMEGIVLIDELETHLHIELQKKILPFLTEFFPNIQFIITTHSPYILTSISNAKCFDLEKKMELDNLSFYTSEDMAEGYFNVDEYSEELKKKIIRYEFLVKQTELTDSERAERAELRIELNNLPNGFGNEAKQLFEEIESSRKFHD